MAPNDNSKTNIFSNVRTAILDQIVLLVVFVDGPNIEETDISNCNK